MTVKLRVRIRVSNRVRYRLLRNEGLWELNPGSVGFWLDIRIRITVSVRVGKLTNYIESRFQGAASRPAIFSADLLGVG